MYKKFISLISQQEVYISVFENSADSHIREIYEDASKDASFGQVQDLRDIAMNKAETGGFGVDPNQWFDTITAKINILKKTDDAVAAEIDSDASAQLYSARNGLIANVIIAVLALAAFAGLLCGRRQNTTHLCVDE